MATELYIDGKLCDLEKKEVIAMSYGVNRLTDIESRQGFYSNTFKLPKTANNLDVFGIPTELNSSDTTRWERLECTIITDGIYQVFGFAQLQSVQDTLSVVVKAGNTDWISIVKDKVLSDLILTDLDHTPNVAHVLANRFNDYNSGYVYPDIDYGIIRQEENPIMHHYLKPSTFVRSVFNQVFIDAGFTITSELESDSKYNAMVLPFSNGEPLHSEYWETDKFFKVQFGETVASPSIGSIRVDMDSIDYDNGNHVVLADNEYNPNDIINSQTFKIKITYTLAVYTGTTGDNFSIKAQSDSGVVAFNVLEIIPTAAGTFDVEGTFEWHDQRNNPLHIRLFTWGNDDIKIDSGFLESSEIDPTYVIDSEWNVAKNLPDLPQSDLVKYVLNAFCAIISTDTINNVVTIAKFDSIPTNTAEDWSDKIDQTDKAEHSFKYGNYKRNNKLLYDINKDDIYLKATPLLGSHTIVNDQEEKGDKTLYKAPLSLVANGRTYDDTKDMALINMNDVVSSYSPMVFASEMTITSATTEGVVTVTSGASQLKIGMGVILYNLDDLLFEGPLFFPNFDGWAEDRVFIVSGVTGGTEFQLEGDFHYQNVTGGNCRAGVIVDKFNKTYINALSLGEAATDDNVIFYDTDGSATVGGDSINGMALTFSSVLTNRCAIIKQKKPYTSTSEYASVVVANDSAITTGNVRIVKTTTENKDAKPRIGIHSVLEDTDNAISIYGQTTETDISKVSYDSITWDVLATAYWVSLTEIIKYPQMLKLLIRLSAVDINQIDFSKPKWIDLYNCYFYLSFVSQYKVNQVDSTEVELIKLP